MKHIIYKIAILTLTVLLLVFSSGCIQEKFDFPENPAIPVGDTLTLQDLWNIYDTLNGKSYKFTTDCSVFATVTMSDKIGNIYKSAYVEDETKAINLHLLSSGGLYEGDYVRIYLKGLVLSDYSGMIQLDSVHVDNNIVKVSTHKFVEPEIVSIEEINTGQYVGKLVKLNDVQFADSDLGSTYADKVNLETINKTLVDCSGNTIDVRNSGYANFAGDTIPNGNGSIIAIVGRYNSDWQLFIRNSAEVDMTGRRCGDIDAIFSEDFNSSADGEFTATSWKNIAQSGNAKWNVNTQIARIDGNASEENISWLITPEINLAQNSFLSFKSRAMGANAVLKVLVSTNYNGENYESATWTELNANIAVPGVSGLGDWAISGNINLSEYTGQNVYVAFKFESPIGISGRYYLDDFLVFF